jgi:peroxiredoxin
MDTSLRRPFATFAAIALAITAAATALYFWNRTRELEGQVAALEKAVPKEVREAIRPPVLRAGMALPGFTARDTEGREVHVAARGGGKSLLFIFEPGCPRCEANLPRWTEIFDKLGSLGAKTQVVALSTGPTYETVEYARSHGLPFPVVPFPTDEIQRSFGVVQVPLTVVLSAQGEVEAFWDKPLSEGEAGDVVETSCPECL